MKMYDVHSHLGKTSSGEENTPRDLVEDLKKFGISKVGISCLSGTVTRAQNDLVYRAMRAYPGIIEGLAFIHPKDPQVFDEIDRCLGDYKMIGVKFHSWKHGYYPDNCPSLDAIFDRVARYGVHVQVHSGTAPMSTPFPWAEYARKHPDVDFVFTHLGYYEFGCGCVEAVKDLKNVWVETSGQFEVDVLKRAFDVLGAKRIVFGTDWPYKITNIEIDKFRLLRLTDAQMEDVFYKNAEYLWRMN